MKEIYASYDESFVEQYGDITIVALPRTAYRHLLDLDVLLKDYGVNMNTAVVADIKATTKKLARYEVVCVEGLGVKSLKGYKIITRELLEDIIYYYETYFEACDDMPELTILDDIQF